MCVDDLYLVTFRHCGHCTRSTKNARDATYVIRRFFVAGVQGRWKKRQPKVIGFTEVLFGMAFRISAGLMEIQ